MSVARVFESMEYGPAPEADTEARRWLERYGGSFWHFIGGDWTKPKSGKWMNSFNPANGEKLAEIAIGNAEDVDRAVSAARHVQPSWGSLAGHVRARHLYALARLIQKHGRLLSVLESMDNGKPIRETRDIDIPLVARHFYHHAGWAQLLGSEFPDHLPVGVAGQIIPWNFPLLMLAWKVAPALAAGNTIVLKPAEYTGLTALLFSDLCRQAGLPGGVVNIVTGPGSTGELIARHPGIDKIAFTGSTQVGREIRTATAGTGKKLTLELGGKSPFIVFEDADLDSAVEGVVDAIWFNQGQVCCAGSRLLVQEGIEERTVAKLKARMETLRVGDPLDKSIDIGAIVAPVQLERIESLVRQGQEEGAELWQPSWACPKEGLFYPPSLFTGVSPAATVASVEIFGPVLAVMSFRTPDEAVALANNSRYGLAASVWSENINLALDVAPKLKVGVVWINSTNLFDAACGFGGYRESGFGREGGREGLLAYLKPAWESSLPSYEADAPRPTPMPALPRAVPAVDRTAKMYIGGKQKRPDGNYNRPVLSPEGEIVGEVGEGNRKDIRDAVEAAHKASAWTRSTPHYRAQILYYIAENLDARGREFQDRIMAMTGTSRSRSRREVEAATGRLFTYAAWADKHEGIVHSPPLRDVTLAMNEPVGVIGLVCPVEPPLLGFVSMVAPAISMGNTVVVVPSEPHPLSATDLYQVFETSDLPGGVVNIVTGERDILARTLTEHDDVDALWYDGSMEGSAMVEAASTGNLKQTWVNYGRKRDWFDSRQGEGRDYLRAATQVKNIWVPYGE